MTIENRFLRIVPTDWVLGSVVFLVGACTTFRTVTTSDLQTPGAATRALLTRADHSKVMVNSPSVANDSVQGTVGGRRTSVALSDIVSIEVEESAPAKTGALVVGVVGGAVLATLIVEANKEAPCGVTYDPAGNAHNVCDISP